MRRRLRTGHLTSGKRAVQPWLTEANSNLILVHLGGIHDEELLAAGRGYATARRNMGVKSSTNGSSTTSTLGSAGSAEGPSGIIGNTPTVYWKSGYGMATNEDQTASRTVSYARGLFSSGGYIVLRRVASTNLSAAYWSMGVKQEGDYEPDQQDYVIAYAAGNDVTQIWSSDIKYTSNAPDHPFKVVCDVIEDELAVFHVVPGTINNIVPSNLAVPILCTEDEPVKYVYLAAYTDVGESDEYLISVTIIADTEENKPNTDDYGYLKLAKIYADGTVVQYVSGSVWSERHKYTEPDSATYYYYRV
jgi:hypothetical protein